VAGRLERFRATIGSGGQRELRTAMVVIGVGFAATAVGLLLTQTPREPPWRTALLVALLVVGVFLVVLAFAWMRQSGRTRLRIDGQVRQATRLRERLLNEAVPLPEASGLVTTWRDETLALLDGDFPHYAGLFRTIPRTAQADYGRGELNGEICYLDDHLERLAEILVRLD
jgi:uncharacterized membrane protein YbhN (UPF0104 family)